MAVGHAIEDVFEIGVRLAEPWGDALWGLNTYLVPSQSSMYRQDYGVTWEEAGLAMSLMMPRQRAP